MNYFLCLSLRYENAGKELKSSIKSLLSTDQDEMDIDGKSELIVPQKITGILSKHSTTPVQQETHLPIVRLNFVINQVCCHFISQVNCHFTNQLSCHFISQVNCHFVNQVNCHFIGQINCHFISQVNCHFISQVKCQLVKNTEYSRTTVPQSYYPLANEVAKGYSNATFRPSVTSLWTL
jgi:hypothetical protein